MRELEIKPLYEHSKAGMFMFNLCARGTEFVVKHRGLYYLTACTGGIFMTIVGVFITIGLGIVRIFTKKIKFEKFDGVYLIKAGPEWGGGFEMGLMFVRDHKSGDYSLNSHEFGHTFQNCILGPFMLFAVSLPSAIRYGYRELKGERKGKTPPTDYDDIWFEDAATQCGKFAHNYLASLKK